MENGWERPQKLIEYKLFIQSDNVIRASTNDTFDSGELDKEPLEEAKDDYLEELEREGRLTSKIRLQNLGKRFYKALFNGNIEGHFRQQVLRPVQSDPKTHCHISIIFQEKVSPNIISLPWEFLFVPNEKIFLATSPKFSFSYKYEDWLALPQQSYAQKDLPLRILFVHFHPKDLAGIGHLMVRKNIGRLDAESDELMNPTVQELQEKLQQYRPHVFHFLTHGRFNRKEGEFALLDSAGETLWYDDQSFGDLFQIWQPGLVVVQACKSGQLSEIKAFAGPAGSLMRKQVPAVVLMRYPIEQKRAWDFDAKFYKALADNEPIDRAVQKGRYALAVSNDTTGHGSHEFAIPTLWLRSGSHYLFQPEREENATEPATSAFVTEKPSHSPEIRAYLEGILCDTEELDKCYIDLSATTTQTHVSLQDKKFNWSRTLVPSAFRAIDRHSNPQQQESRLLDSIGEALEIHPCFVLLGSPGCGKTTTFKKLQSDTAKLAEQDHDARIPLLFNLSLWPDGINDIPGLIQHARQSKGLPPIHVNRLLLLLDGLNEVAAQAYVPRVKLLEEWLRINPSVSMIISCRQKHYQNNKRLSIPEVQIEPFDYKRIRLFLNAYLGTELAHRLLPQLGPLDPAQRSPRDLIHLADNPFFLFIICYVYWQNNECLPGSRGHLFQIFVDTLYTREKDLGLTNGLSAQELDAGLSALAFAMQKLRSATAVHLVWAEKQIPKNISPSSLWQLGQGASLVQFTKGERFIQFSHQLLLEYFAAESLCQRLENLPAYIVSKPGFSRYQRKGQPWDEVIYTMAGIAEPNVLLKKIAETDPFLAEDCFGHVPTKAEISRETQAYVIKRLIDFFKSRGREVRAVAVAKLVKIGSAAIPYLIKVVQSDNSSQVVKRAALRGLAEYDDFEALYAIFSALEYKGWVRKDAKKILYGMDNIKIQTLLNGIDFSSVIDSEKATQLIKMLSEKEIQEILPEDTDENWMVRLASLKTFGESGDEKRTADICLTALKDEHPIIRETALNILRELGDERLANKCLSALDDVNPTVRSTALNILRELGDERLADKCLPALNDENLAVRIAALNALRELGNEQLADKCLPALNDENLIVRLAAASVMLKLRANSLTEKGSSILKKEMLHLCSDLKFSYGQHAKITLITASIQLGYSELINQWVLLELEDNKAMIRKAAVTALGELGNPQFIEKLQALLKDKNKSVREKSKEVIKKLQEIKKTQYKGVAKIAIIDS